MAASDEDGDFPAYRRERELTHAERDRRWDRVREAMAEAGLDLLVTPPNPGFWDQLQASATYLSTIGGNNAPVSVIFPREGEVTAVVGAVPAASFWRAWQSWVTDVRATPWKVGDGVIARLREVAADGKRIGVPGLAGTARFPDGLASTGFIARIKQEFPRAEIVDATPLLDGIRARKSAEERASVAEAVAMTEEAFRLLVREARPGVSERALYGRMVGHLIELGSLPTNFLMWSAGNHFHFHLAPFPTKRPLVAGEPVYCEIEARSTSGYIGQITRMLCLGQPTETLSEMFDLCARTFNNVLELMRPGATMGEVLAVYKDGSRSSRYRAVPVIHARALGEDRPMIIFDTQDEDILNLKIMENHVFAVKVQVRDEESQQMAFFGESVAIGVDRAMRLARDEIALHVVG